MRRRKNLWTGSTLLFLLLLLIACKKPAPDMPIPNTDMPIPPTATNDTAKRYLALGDSYTIGQSVGEHERFPYLTVAILRQQQVAIEDPVYIATTGWTTIDLQQAIQRVEPLGTYDVVTLLIGVNDQYRGLDTTGYRNRFEQLLVKAITLAGDKPSHVFVLSIPDYSATPFVAADNKEQVHREIAEFNVINKRITEMHGVTYVDITPLTEAAAQDNSLLANDGLHYSGKEHQYWAEKLAPLLLPVLK